MAQSSPPPGAPKGARRPLGERRRSGYTPLLYAAYHGRAELVQVLLSAGPGAPGRFHTPFLAHSRSHPLAVGCSHSFRFCRLLSFRCFLDCVMAISRISTMFHTVCTAFGRHLHSVSSVFPSVFTQLDTNFDEFCLSKRLVSNAFAPGEGNCPSGVPKGEISTEVAQRAILVTFPLLGTP